MQTVSSQTVYKQTQYLGTIFRTALLFRVNYSGANGFELVRVVGSDSTTTTRVACFYDLLTNKPIRISITEKSVHTLGRAASKGDWNNDAPPAVVQTLTYSAGFVYITRFVP